MAKKNQTWVSTGLTVTGNEGKARQIMLDMLGEKLSRLPRPICFSVTPCAAGWRTSGIAWTRSPTKDTRYRPGHTSFPTFDDLQIRLCDVDGETLQAYINVKAKFGRSDGHGAFRRSVCVSARTCSIRRSNWRRETV